MEKLYTVRKKKRPVTDCGLDHELIIAKFWLKLKKLEKTTIPFRYEPNKIHYDSIVEVTNIFKGLVLVDRVLEELWMLVHNIVQEVVTKIIHRKRKCKRQSGCLRRPYK